MSSRALTTTSFAILGALAHRPWPAYELTGYLRGSAVRRFWPRTESRLYAEPKNLVAHGLAEASKEYTGKRARTVYRITDQGRRALAEWLSERPSRQEMQDEAMLKIVMCDHGSRTQLLATIRSALEALLGQVEALEDISDRIARGEPQLPGRIHVTALTSMDGIRMIRQRYDSLVAIEAWVREWDGTGLDDAKAERAREILARNREELMRIGAALREKLASR